LSQLNFCNIGPDIAGGRISSAAGSNRDAALYYIGSAGGGVWKTTTAGTEWQPVFDRQPFGSIGSVAIDPNNDDVVWAGTGEANPRNDVSPGGGIYKTSDGGKSWKFMGLKETVAIGKISIDPGNSNQLVVAALGDPFANNSERGVYRTTDGGATWLKVLSLGPQSGASDVARAAKNPNLLFAGIWQFRRTGWSVQSGGETDGLLSFARRWRNLGAPGGPWFADG